MNLAIHTRGLLDVQRFYDRLPDVAARAASLAVNDTTTRTALPQIRNDMGAQIAFPSGYLKLPSRLGVTRKASPQSLEARITARDRPTSLARFSTPTGARTKGIRVEVKRGARKLLKKAFIVGLKNGNSGLAIRLKDGEKVEGKRDEAVRLSKNVYLLYGPSVDQVFKGVAPTKDAIIQRELSKQFLRQFARLSGG